MANWNDLELAQRIRSGDREAEDEIVRRFHDRIARKVCYFLEQNREGAKDLIQDTMMEVLRSLREGKFDAARGTQLGDYISGIAGNMM
jgi:DNA-directed RNA polymerase specialized sigma24 family protein